MSDPDELTVANVQVNTAAVTVQTLTLKGKQMTLSVFRQIQEQQLILHEGQHSRWPRVPLQLLGQPWGWVNYCDRSCSSEDRYDHRHVIWIDVSAIRRSTVVIPYRGWGRNHIGARELRPESWTDETPDLYRAQLLELLDRIPQLFIAV